MTTKTGPRPSDCTDHRTDNRGDERGDQRGPIAVGILPFCFCFLCVCTSCDQNSPKTATQPPVSPNIASASKPDATQQTLQQPANNTNRNNSTSDQINQREAPLEPSKRNAKLSIAVSESKQASGQCLIAIYASRKGFNQPESAIAKAMVDLQSGQAIWDVEIPVDDPNNFRIAVSAFLDSNGNGSLDKNSFGIPTEAYGFSNNPKRGFGPPRFEEVATDVKQTDGVAQISIQIY